MSRLLGLRLFVRCWKAAIAISDKLPTRVWNVIALAFILLLAFSVIGLLYSKDRKEAHLVKIAEATMSHTFKQPEIRELPLNNRNFVQLVTLLPGVSSITDEACLAAICRDGNATHRSSRHYDIGGNRWGNTELESYTSRISNPYLDCQGYLDISTLYKHDSGGSRLLMQTAKLAVQNRASGSCLKPFWMLDSNVDSVIWPTCGEVDILADSYYSGLYFYTSIDPELAKAARAHLTVKWEFESTSNFSGWSSFNTEYPIDIRKTSQGSTSSGQPASGITVNFVSQPSEKQPSTHDALFWVSLLGTIANTLGTISTIILAWISNKRFEAELLLKRAEAAQKQVEAELKLKQMELEILKLQCELKGPPLIII